MKVNFNRRPLVLLGVAVFPVLLGAMVCVWMFSAPISSDSVESSHVELVVFADKSTNINQEFILHNPTPTPQTIVQVVKSCTCGMLLMNKKPLAAGTVIEANTSGVIHLSADVGSRKGYFEFNASVVADSTKTWAFGVKAHIVESIQFEREQLNLLLDSESASQIVDIPPIVVYTHASNDSPPIPKLELNEDLRGVASIKIIESCEVMELPNVRRRATSYRLLLDKSKLVGPMFPVQGHLIASAQMPDATVERRCQLIIENRSHYTYPSSVFFNINAVPLAESTQSLSISRLDGNCFAVNRLEWPTNLLSLDCACEGTVTKCILNIRAQTKNVEYYNSGFIKIHIAAPFEEVLSIPIVIFRKRS